MSTTSEASILGSDAQKVPALSWAWVVKKSALWAFILALGITLACWLYAAASPDGSAETQNPAAAQQAKQI